MTSGLVKFTTHLQVAPGQTISAHWNNANAEVYSLSAVPVVVAGATGQAEITKTFFLTHDNPTERELHYSVKNTGATTINIEVWAA